MNDHGHCCSCPACIEQGKYWPFSLLKALLLLLCVVMLLVIVASIFAKEYYLSTEKRIQTEHDIYWHINK